MCKLVVVMWVRTNSLLGALNSLWTRPLTELTRPSPFLFLILPSATVRASASALWARATYFRSKLAKALFNSDDLALLSVRPLLLMLQLATTGKGGHCLLHSDILLLANKGRFRCLSNTKTTTVQLRQQRLFGLGFFGGGDGNLFVFYCVWKWYCCCVPTIEFDNSL